MAALNFVDGYVGQVNATYTAGGTSLTIASATSTIGSAVLPSGACNFWIAVLAEGSNTLEFMQVTNRSGTTLTVVGAQDSSAASNHAVGAVILASSMTQSAFSQYTTDVRSTCVQQLGKVTTSSSQATVTFSSISGNFTNLYVTYACRSNATGSEPGLRMQFNGDTTNGDYSTVVYMLDGGGATPSGGTVGSGSAGTFINNCPYASVTANYPATGRIWIPNYSATVFYKKWFHTGNYAQLSGPDLVITNGATWISTAAITSILIQLDSSQTFLDGSVFTLYGEP